MRQARKAAAILAAASLASSVAHADDLEARAARLGELRAEVASLQAKLTERNDQLAAELRALDLQRIDLEVQGRREAMRLDKLQDDLAGITDRAASGGDVEDAVRPAFDRGLAALRQHVADGLPFRIDERLAALDELEAQVTRGDLTPSRAVGRLWAFVEDELRLTRENVLDRQVVPVGGAEVLADVARLGMVALFYRAPDGSVGFVARTGDGWAWTAVDGREDVRRVDALFETLRKGIRTGWFELPWPFGEVQR